MQNVLDIDLSAYDALGEVVKYGFTSPEEVPERVKDADVLIVNKVEINEQIQSSLILESTLMNSMEKPGESSDLEQSEDELLILQKRLEHM